MRLSAFAWGDAAYHLCAVFNGLFRMKRALLARETLAENFCLFVNEDHDTSLMEFTMRFAASVRLCAAIIFKPLALNFFAPMSALLPSSRTTTGILMPTSLTASMMPSAIKSQRT